MANPHRGEVALKVGDLDYKLSFSINAMCELEDLMDRPIAEIASSLNDPASLRMSTVRAIAWAALRDHHPDVDIKSAGIMVTSIGINVAMEAIGRAFAMAFPEAQGKANPQKAARAG